MPLTNVKLLPGFDKTDTPSGAEGRWIDGDFVRFRYAQPEKIALVLCFYIIDKTKVTCHVSVI